MKKFSKVLVLMMSLVLTLLIIPSCEKPPQTLEEYLNANEESSEKLDKVVEDTDIDDFYVEGNNVTYVCDLTKHDTTKDIDEETIKSDVIKENLEKALDESSDTFSGMCVSLESESQIEGITITIIYKYGDDELLKKQYSSSGSVDSNATDTANDTSDDSDDSESGESDDGTAAESE